MLIATILHFTIGGIIDICLVIALFMLVYKLTRGTTAQSIFIGVIAIYILWALAKHFNLELLSKIMEGFISVGFIAMIIIFQPEIRKFLNMVGSKTITNRRYKWLFRKTYNKKGEVFNSTAIVQACGHMSNSMCGALIIICRFDKLEAIITSGESLDAQINTQLIETIFFKNTPLHDGAMIIDNNKIKAARCILPVSHSNEIPVSLGLRHRSAIGITEDSDAIAIIVSEQTGLISIAEAGKIQTNVTLTYLQEYLDNTFNSKE
ncbi:MAG: diadenylate cyclase CdaA [Bacteroidales bacterium]|jgi:uncharacterized protein (TIGR00159 family)|nr:diadenylate cyclase CdaA [Bacteroidales bacterium]